MEVDINDDNYSEVKRIMSDDEQHSNLSPVKQVYTDEE